MSEVSGAKFFIALGKFEQLAYSASLLGHVWKDAWKFFSLTDVPRVEVLADWKRL